MSIGEGKQQFMHTISAGDEASPPMVVLPGYGAGSGFYFRNIDGLAQRFRLHCVDLLGTGMSGAQSALSNFLSRMKLASLQVSKLAEGCV